MMIRHHKRFIVCTVLCAFQVLASLTVQSADQAYSNSDSKHRTQTKQNSNTSVHSENNAAKQFANQQKSTNSLSTSNTRVQIPVQTSRETAKWSVTGKVKITGKGSARANVKNTIIYFEPDDPSYRTVNPNHYEMLMKKKAFVPRVLVVEQGSKVTIPNYDNILHNAFSPTGNNRFDTKLYGKSEGKTVTFKNTGISQIFCNVHYHMVGYVLVLDTPHYTQANEDGSFELANIPPTPGKITVWHERAKKVTRIIDQAGLDALSFELPITRRKIPKHKNKFGKKYRKKRKY
jgi:plastocyanin